jgi:uncharacterized protein (TIGR04255 family)
MGQKMKHAPVYFTIAQVRFNTLWALDSYAPAIQESMRKAGFPDPRKSLLATFNLTPVTMPGGGTEPPPQQIPVAQAARYIFANVDATAGFVLDQGALSLQATEYDIFETFSETFLKGLEMVHSAVGLDFSDRVGVRYLDAVFPRDGETLDQYLHESVRGLAGKLEGELSHSFSETLTRTPAASVISRVIIEQGSIGFPPDLLPMWLKVPERFVGLSGLHAIVDTDGFVEQREAFDLARIGQRLNAAHDEIGKSFRATVTPYAMNVWE